MSTNRANSTPRRCPLCNHAPGEPWLRKGSLALARCKSCGMVYAERVPSEFGSGGYYDEAGTVYYLSPAKLESDYAQPRFERELALFRRHCASGLVLDVGCSSGAFLFQLRQRFRNDYEVLGTDVSQAPLDYAESRGIPVLRGDFPSHDFGSRTFDAITFWAVLEHLAEPRSFLNQAWTILAPGGLCFVLVPNLESLAMRCLGARYRYIYPQHLNYFSRGTLGRLVNERFKVIEARSMHFNPLVMWQDWRRGGAEVSNQERASLLLRTTRYKRSALLAPLRTCYRLAERTLGTFNLADNLAVVLRKPAVGPAVHG